MVSSEFLQYGTKMDNSLTLFDAATHAADTLSSAIDFGVAEGCPEAALFINVTATDGTTNIEIHTSDDDNTYAALPLQLVGIAAAGQYVILLNNVIVKKRYMKIKDNLNAATSVTLSAFLVPNF